MKKQLQTWQLISKSIDESIPVVLLFVVESKGSSPGRQGFCMAVNAAGEMAGSIGGGIMEHKFVEMAKARLAQQAVEAAVHKQVHDKSAPKHQSGMICSGEQTILVYTVQAVDKAPVENLIKAVETNQKGMLTLSPTGIEFTNEEVTNASFIQTSEDSWKYTQTVGPSNFLYIIGGGHCALAFSKIMSSMDFYIALYDDRPHLNTIAQNNYVNEKHIVNDYSELEALIHPKGNSYIVLMTFGYRSDDIALRAIIKKSFNYIGLLGSKKKIEKMFDDYKREGIDDQLIARIHAPVGVPINSQTPEEIAVSIAAEIISVKNGAAIEV